MSEIKLNPLPSAKPERKKGKWITDVAYYDENGCPCVVTRCSECGEASLVSNYCPNCGADMRGGQILNCGADMRGETNG